MKGSRKLHKKEGELYKTVNAFGKIYKIYYGYYADYERESIWGEPVPIYPDLKANPEYSENGYPIVTEMQIACDSYSGKESEDSCAHCSLFEKGEDLFGLCKRRRRENDL